MEDSKRMHLSHVTAIHAVIYIYIHIILFLLQLDHSALENRYCYTFLSYNAQYYYGPHCKVQHLKETISVISMSSVTSYTCFDEIVTLEN